MSPGYLYTIAGLLSVSTLGVLHQVADAASIAILALQAGIRLGNIATSWLEINLSSGIPTIESILAYHEAVSVRKAIALSLIPISMGLLWLDKLQDERRRGTDVTLDEPMTCGKESQ